MVEAAKRAYVYDVLPRETISGTTGRQVLDAIVDGRLPQAPISQVLNLWLTEVGDGVAVFEGEPAAHLLNPVGVVHGGWALTLVDSAGVRYVHAATQTPCSDSGAPLQIRMQATRHGMQQWMSAIKS